MNTLISLLSLLLVVLLVTALVQVQCKNETCTERYAIIPGPTPRDGRDGIQGVPGRTGDKGDRGDIGPTGPKGDPGIATITEEELSRVNENVTAKINESIIAELLDTIQALNQTLTDRLLYLESQFVTVCNITSANWKRIAYFDTTQGDSCPTGLRTVTNTTTNQTACGRMNTTSECASVPIPVQSNYSRVCGIVKGYQDSTPDAFGPFIRGNDSTIDMPYVDGVSITQGSPRRHLWTYATGVAEEASDQRHRCPCARSDPNDTSYIPDFVGDNYYCESGFSASFEFGVVTWDDPLWDGKNCVNPNNTCCERYGWFHRDVPLSSDDIELRICADQSVADEDTLIELYEFWVM